MADSHAIGLSCCRFQWPPQQPLPQHAVKPRPVQHPTRIGGDTDTPAPRAQLGSGITSPLGILLGAPVQPATPARKVAVHRRPPLAVELPPRPATHNPPPRPVPALPTDRLV